MPLHSSLGNKSETLSQKKKNTDFFRPLLQLHESEHPEMGLKICVFICLFIDLIIYLFKRSSLARLECTIIAYYSLEFLGPKDPPILAS